MYKQSTIKPNLILFHKNISSLSKFIFDDSTTETDQYLEIDVTHLKEIEIDVKNEGFSSKFGLKKLKKYFLDMKNIEKLKLIYAKNISQFFLCISHFSKTLKVFNYYYHSTLDVKPFLKNCHQLEELSLSKRRYSCLNEKSETIELKEIFNLRNLKKLYLKSCFFDNKNENLLEKNCSGWKHLNEIALEHCKMSLFHTKYFRKALEVSHDINYVYLNAVRFSKEIFCGLFSSSKNLKTLCIINCKFDTETSEALKLLLENSIQLKTFQFKSNRPKKDEFKKFLDGLVKSNKSLKEISFENSLKGENCEDMKNFLLNCIHLEKVNFSNNKSISDGLFLICEGLKNSPQYLKYVNFEKSLTDKEQFEYVKDLQLKWANMNIDYSYSNDLLNKISLDFRSEALFSVYNYETFGFGDFFNDPYDLAEQRLDDLFYWSCANI